MTDLISRAEAIEAVQTYLDILINSRRHGDDFTFINVLTDIRNKISALPSAEQVTGKLKNPCDSLLTEDSEERKEQKSKLDLIRRADAIDAIDDSIDADSPQWAILRTKIGFLPSAEAVQVVRCKDCRWYNCNACYRDDGVNNRRDNMDFCSYGERKGGADMGKEKE